MNHPSNRIETKEQLDQIFKHHAPSGNQQRRYVALRFAALEPTEAG